MAVHDACRVIISDCGYDGTFYETCSEAEWDLVKKLAKKRNLKYDDKLTLGEFTAKYNYYNAMGCACICVYRGNACGAYVLLDEAV